MGTSLKGKAKSLLRRVPLIERELKRKARKKRFRTEIDLIRGDHTTENTHPSVLHFSFNKAATQYIKGILRRCATDAGMVPVDIHDYAFDTDFPYLDQLTAEEMKQYHYLFKPQGYLYSVFGGMFEGLPDLDQYRTVLVTRDPRDILVSSYYSIAFSHVEPDKDSGKSDEFARIREQARSVEVDEHVIQESEGLLDIFRRYDDLLLKPVPDVHVTSYEEMVADFPRWLDRLTAYCEFPLGESLRGELIEENERKKPREENVNRHMRKGEPGNFRQKLKPEMVEILNEKFKPLLERFGFDRDAGS